MSGSGGDRKRLFVPPTDEISMDSVQADTKKAKVPIKFANPIFLVEGDDRAEEEVQDDPVLPSNLQCCSLCGQSVEDLAAHIVDDHTELQDMERDERKGSMASARTPVRFKGRYRQVKPVLRYPCDGCRTVAKSSDQLKKHMILAHNGHKNTSWMFCGDCEYATRVEDELVNHVKVHQIFNILKEDFKEEEEEEEEVVAAAAPQATERVADPEDDFSPTPMSCGDCDFETHYESELFLHLKIHIGKEDEYGPVTEKERIRLEKMAKKEAFVLVEGNAFLCNTCSFRTNVKTRMAEHCRKTHGIEVDAEGKKIIHVRQSYFYCTLCPFKGKTKNELTEHKRNTIHHKRGGTQQIKHNPLKRVQQQQ